MAKSGCWQPTRFPIRLLKTYKNRVLRYSLAPGGNRSDRGKRIFGTASQLDFCHFGLPGIRAMA